MAYIRDLGQVAFAAAGLLILASAATAAWAGGTERVSVSSRGAQGNDGSGGFQDSHGGTYVGIGVAISAGGRFVAFQSNATNLVPGDTNAAIDIFVRDRREGTTERVSLARQGRQADGGSFSVSMSADGRFVAFASEATNVVPGDRNGTADIFVRDRQTGTTERVSVATTGAEADGPSDWPAISANGRFVAFQSDATNLVPGDTNGTTDIFVRDRLRGTTRRASVGPYGLQADERSYFPSLSANGKVVAFASEADNLDPGDTNGAFDVFTRDLRTGRTERVSVGLGRHDSLMSSISADGRLVAFISGGNIQLSGFRYSSDVFVRDLGTRRTVRLTVGPDGARSNGTTSSVAISADGRFVAFGSDASNLVPNDTNDTYDLFVHDRQTGTTERLSLGLGGHEADGSSGDPALSAHGGVVAFDSTATNLVPGDTNGVTDVFVRAR
jgi:Tol biopolymer transport system component